MISDGSHIKYGKALLGAANNSGQDEDILADMKKLLTLAKNAKFKQMLKRIATLKKEQVTTVINEVFKDKLNSISLNLLIILCHNKKTDLLVKVIKSFISSYNEQRGIDSICLITAKDFDYEQREKMAHLLKKQKGKDVHVEFETDPKLIGGVQILEGGYLSDYSVQNYLNTLRQVLSK